MTRSKRFARRSSAVAVAALLCAAATSAPAQEKFPSKTVEVVIHSSYGGGTDTTARMMMIRTRRELEADMVVTAQRGGSGAKAHQYALGKDRDGHTVLALTQTHLYTIARGKSPLTIDDVVGVARAMDDPTFITVSADGPYKDLQSLVEAAKQKPLNWGVAQVGGTEHIGLAQFAKAAGFKLLAKSEVNANPKDRRDHPEGVWTLPPGLRLGDTDREKYLAIGESDRMTLRFRKPAED